jgi:hypothetical protein
MEPITLFARIADPAGIAKRLGELVPDLEIDGPDDLWTEAIVRFSAKPEPLTITISHNPDYYSEPGWSQQMAGMRGYFEGFPDSDRKQKVLLLTTTFRFALGTMLEPDIRSNDDPRIGLLTAMAELVDGVLFTPGALRDRHGRILLSAGGPGDEHPDAEWPRVVGEVDFKTELGATMHEMSRPKPPEEDETAADAPSAERVARRALAMTALTARAILEQDATNPDYPPIHQKVLHWAGDLGLDQELEPDELATVHKPLGQLDPQEQTNATWRLEGLVVLAWALGRFEIPPHDELVDFNAMWQSLGFLDRDASNALLAHPELKPREEIHALRNRLFALHWRLRNFHIRREPMNFVEFAETCWFGPLDISALPIVEGDLALQGARIDRAPPQTVATVHSAAQERHQAANWLREGPNAYSEASVAT